MERSLIPYNSNLPAYDELERCRRRGDLTKPSIEYEDIKEYIVDKPHLVYLSNKSYDKYLRMHKVFVGESGSAELADLGEALGCEKLPRYLDAAGWAFAESGLVNEGASAVERVQYIDRGKTLWERSLAANEELEVSDYAPWFHEASTPFRTALNLAYVPIMKSIVVGNVAESVRQRAFADTLAIAQTSAVQLQLASKAVDQEDISDHLGFLHECNALLALLYLNDPRYVPLPSSARADSGYYNYDQTHDITVLNQHWGKIRKVIPMEIKAAASQHDRERYKALIVRGKMHLSVEGKYDPRYTLNAFADVFDHSSMKGPQAIVDHATSTIKDLLKLYQQGSPADMKKMNSLTHFYDTDQVGRRYRELARASKRS